MIKTKFLQKSIDDSDWLASSPDFDPIENLWGIIARAVYTSGKQIDSVSSLKLAIMQE